jgi:hypothetical protein
MQQLLCVYVCVRYTMRPCYCEYILEAKKLLISIYIHIYMYIGI